MKFNSQICTTREQSEALLKLGLKKETADMVWTHAYYGTWVVTESQNPFYEDRESIPAWSLHRLMCLCFNSGATHVELFEDDDAYEILIYKIEMRIKKGYFNKEYLV